MIQHKKQQSIKKQINELWEIEKLTEDLMSSEDAQMWGCENVSMSRGISVKQPRSKGS